MDRRAFLHSAAALPWLRGATGPLAGLGTATVAVAAAPADNRYRRLLVLVELKGGNDGLNTLVPFADPAYYALRPKIAIARIRPRVAAATTSVSGWTSLPPTPSPIARSNPGVTRDMPSRKTLMPQTSAGSRRRSGRSRRAKAIPKRPPHKVMPAISAGPPLAPAWISTGM